jgi:hypothetical protein
MGRLTQRDADTAAMQAAEHRLRALLASERLTGGARSRQLHRLRGRAATLGPTVRSPSRRRRPGLSGVRRRAVAVAAAASLAAVLGSGLTVTAGSAVPGEALYGVKQAAERLHQVLPADEATRVDRLLAIADARFDEAAALTGRGLGASDVTAATLHAHVAALEAAADAAEAEPQLQARVATATSTAQELLAELLAGGLPEQAADRAREALQDVLNRFALHGSVQPAVVEDGAQPGASQPPDAEARRAMRATRSGPAAGAPPAATNGGPPAADAPPANAVKPSQPAPASPASQAGGAAAQQQSTHPQAATPSQSATHNPDLPATARPGGGSPPPPPGDGPRPQNQWERSRSAR